MIPQKEGKVSVLKKSGRLRLNPREKSRSNSPDKLDVQTNENMCVDDDALTAKTILEHPEMTLRRSNYEPSSPSKFNHHLR